MSAPTHVAVVIPARDEQLLLPRCLAAVEAAVAGLAETVPHVRARVFVVLDSCVDQTARVIEGRDVATCVTQAGRVGAARSIGVDAAAAWAGAGAELWVANTDADVVVPPHWLTLQFELAARGADMLVGTVEPETSGTSPWAHQEWLSRHTLADGHEHVHGANLGFSLAAYRQAGGFQPVLLHEDVLLVHAVRATGRPWVATDETRVLTSSRRISRVLDGFGTYLQDLDDASA